MAQVGMKGMHAATRVPKMTLPTAPSCLAGLLLRLKEEKTGFFGAEGHSTRMFALVWFDWRALCNILSDIVPYRTGCPPETRVGRAAEKAGSAREQESFRNLRPRTGS